VGTLKQLERDIENGFRTLEMLDSYLQRIFKDKQELELGESLAHLTVQKEETQQQLIHRREEKLTKEMAWTEEQKSVYELQQNLLSDDKNTEHLREMEKILSEREEEIKQLRNLTNDEIFVLEEKVKDLDRRISEFQDNRSTKLEELLNQESTLQIKKKDLIEDLKQKVEESKVLEIKLIQNKAAERFNKLDRYTS
jgi:chromosome segregation ATPase